MVCPSSLRVGFEALTPGRRAQPSSCSATSRGCSVGTIRALLAAGVDDAAPRSPYRVYPRRRRAQPGAPRSRGLRPRRRRRSGTGASDQSSPPTRSWCEEVPIESRARPIIRTWTRGRPGHAPGGGLGRSRARQQRPGRSLPRSPRRHRLLRPGHEPVPGGPDPDGRTGPGDPARVGPVRATRGWTSGRGRSLRPADRPGGGAVRRRGGRRRPVGRDAQARSTRSPTSSGSRTCGPSRAAGRTPRPRPARPMSLDRPRQLRHPGHRAVRRLHGVGRATALRGGPDGASAVVDRRRLLAAGLGRVADRAAGPAAVRGAAASPWPRTVDRAAGAASRRRFESREALEGFLRRQLWVEPGSAADLRFLAALEPMVVADGQGRVGLRDQRPLPIGIVTWEPGATS